MVEYGSISSLNPYLQKVSANDMYLHTAFKRTEKKTKYDIQIFKYLEGREKSELPSSEGGFPDHWLFISFTVSQTCLREIGRMSTARLEYGDSRNIKHLERNDVP